MTADGLEPSYCKRCGRDILWGTTVNDKKMPLDPVPVKGGNVTVKDGIINVAHKETTVLVGYMPHFATCGARSKK